MHLCWWNKSWRWESINKPFQSISSSTWGLRGVTCLLLWSTCLYITCMLLVCVTKGTWARSPLPVSWVWWSCMHSSQKVTWTWGDMGSCSVNSKLLLNLIQPLKNSGWTWWWSETLVFKADLKDAARDMTSSSELWKWDMLWFQNSPRKWEKLGVLDLQHLEWLVRSPQERDGIEHPLHLKP